MEHRDDRRLSTMSEGAEMTELPRNAKEDDSK